MGRSLGMAALVGAGLLAACVPQVRPDQIAQVKPGQTTYDQVVGVFGVPDYEMNLSGGSKVLLYHRPQFEHAPGQMVPFANLFQANYDRTAYDYFIVGRDGVVQNFSIPHFAREAGVANPGG